MLVKKFKAYLVVGGLGFLIDFTVTLFLANHFHYLVANTVGFLIANTVNFLAGHRFVFNRPWHLKDMAKAYPGVLAVSVVGLILSNLLMFLFIEKLGLSLVFAKIITTGLVLVWNFLARLGFVYRTVN